MARRNRNQGRSARTARMEQRKLDAEQRPVVFPGITGGTFKPLTDSDMERVHAAVLDVLARIGVADATDEVLELALAQGCELNDRGRLCFPRAFVEDMIDQAPSDIVLHGRESKNDLELSDQRVHFGTGGAAVRTLDPGSNQHRPTLLQDVYDFARLADAMDNVHWFTRCVIATELTDPLLLDINTAYACAAGTSKHIGTAITERENVQPVVELFDAVLGGAGRFRDRPFCKLHSSPIVSPLRFGEDAQGVLIDGVRAGMPINVITAPQGGATSPAALAGSLVQSVAEAFSTLALAHFVQPGHPVIFSVWPFVSDLRTGAFSGGGGEEALLNAAAAQMVNFYKLPSGVAAGMSDSKLPDAQSGFEKGITTVMAGLAGANMVYESAGMLASLLVCSYEQFVIDNDMLGFVQRAVKGIEVTDETLSVDVIEETVYGAGHFLGSEQTISIMTSEYVYPQVGDRLSPEDWRDAGSQDMRQRAQHQVNELLAGHFPELIDSNADASIRARFPIKLPAEAMRAETRMTRKDS